MPTLFCSTCFVDASGCTRKSAFFGRVLCDVFRSAGAGSLLLLALTAVASVPASAQIPPPTCTLSVQGSNPSDPLTITAIVNCVPGSTKLKVIFINIDWGDGTTSSSSGASVTATHTYAVADCFVGDFQTPGICEITVTATDSQQNEGSVSGIADLTAPSNPTPVFAGQSSVVQVELYGFPVGQQVTFECTTVIDSSGGVQQASDLGITCTSNPPTITFTGGIQSVAIDIQTSGPAAQVAPHREFFYALLLLLPLFVLSLNRRSRRRAASRCAGAGLVAMILFLSSCGGGFTAPVVVQQTPAGSYVVTVVDEPVTEPPMPGFVQTSLIVPLTVNPVH